MSHDLSTQVYEPGPDCSRFAALLPVLDDAPADSVSVTRAREHLSHCAYCQRQRAAYDRVEAGLRRHFGAALVAPLATMEEMMSDILNSDAEAGAATSRGGTRAATQVAPSRGSRRMLSGLAALAAVLVLSLLATVIFVSHRPASPVTVQMAPVLPKGATLSLAGVSMVSANEGWAAGSYASPENSSFANGVSTIQSAKSPAIVVLYHYLNGTWTRHDVTVSVAGLPQLHAISMDSASDGWAVGDIMNGAGGAILLHYDGHNWMPVNTSIQDGLGAVQMVSANSGWAIGSPGNQHIYHFDGSSWTAQSLPNIMSEGQQAQLQLLGLSMTTSDDGWAVGEALPPGPMVGNTGYPPTSTEGVILHYTGGVWHVAQLIHNTTIRGITMDAQGDGWAVGNDHTYLQAQNASNPQDVTDIQHMLLLHYTGGQWVTVPVPLSDPLRQSGYLEGVQMLSPSNGWIIGFSDDGTLTQTGQTPTTVVFLHYDGAQWSEVPGPVIKNRREYAILSISMTSPSDGWAVGQAFSNEADGIPNSQGPGYIPTITPVILRYHDGAWSVYTS